MDIKPIAKSEEHYQKWVENYSFYANVNRDGVTLYEPKDVETQRDLVLYRNSRRGRRTDCCSGGIYSDG